MPESVDFDQIVMNLWNDGEGCNVPFIVEQLRLVWNARGAADLEAFRKQFNWRIDLEHIERAIKTLDR